MKSGVPPTPRKALTGESTPPGNTFCARANNSADRTVDEETRPSAISYRSPYVHAHQSPPPLRGSLASVNSLFPEGVPLGSTVSWLAASLAIGVSAHRRCAAPWRVSILFSPKGSLGGRQCHGWLPRWPLALVPTAAARLPGECRRTI